MSATITERDYAHACARLREMLPRGSTVYTILRHVSRSGLQRELSLVGAVREDAATAPQKPSDANTCPRCAQIERTKAELLRVQHVTYYAAKVGGWRMVRGALVVKGCGMDLGADVVATLGNVLYCDGKSLRHEWL